VKLFALAAGVMVASTACGSHPPTAAPAVASPPEKKTPAVDTSELDTYFGAHFPADAPGIAVLIAKRGQTVYARGFGLADLNTREAITTRTLFNLGSLSKTFVANAILILQERGKLSVDDPLSKYFPGFKHPELAAKVKLRHLLTHTSGLPDIRPVEAQREFYLSARDAENWQPITQAEALEFEPGSEFDYSNPAFNALALVVEQVSGRKWQAFVHDEIFVPAGMTTSTITDGPHPERGVSHGYVRVGDEWKERDYGEEPTFAAAGNGGVWSSVEELALYERALHDARFLRASTIADSRTVKTFSNWANKEPPRIGWSWFIVDVDDDGICCADGGGGIHEIGHRGSQGGFRTNYFIVPDKDVLVVFLMNAPGDYDGVTSELQRWLKQMNWLD
jgi:CubicO group peptidase (beta-lactamase class C family)